MSKTFNHMTPILSNWTVDTITNAQVFRVTANQFIVQINEGMHEIKQIPTTTYQKAMTIAHKQITKKGVK